MRALLLTLVLAVGALLAGCTGVVDTPKQRWNRYVAITDYNARQGVDDWDYLWLYDRPSYLSYWYVRYAD
jgi:uncharacterized protein YceK